MRSKLYRYIYVLMFFRSPQRLLARPVVMKARWRAVRSLLGYRKPESLTYSGCHV